MNLALFRFHWRYSLVKSLLLSLLLTTAALAQTPDKTVTFRQTDTQHCRVINVSGKPLLQSTYNGVSVAIAMPINKGNGDFLIFIAVSEVDGEPIQVDPGDFYARFSDKDHTRFTFADVSSQLPVQGPQSDTGMSASNAQIDPGSIRPGAVGPGGPPSGSAPSGPAGSGPATAGSSAYLRKAKVKPGSGIAGWVTLRQPKGAKLEVRPTDMLDEIDIPVHGILFRF